MLLACDNTANTVPEGYQIHWQGIAKLVTEFHYFSNSYG